MHVPPTFKQYLPTITVPEHGNYPSVLDSIPGGRFASIVDVEDQEYQVYERTGNYWTEYARYPCSTGKNPGPKQYAGDHKTPEGILRISKIQDSHDWINDGKTYGKWFCRAEETIDGRIYKGIGIHGTNEESALGSPASLGCIRLKNATVDSLVQNGVLAPGAYVAVVH
jgi:lipoprotein-anchoring transpeptidase ErfK/SrfK